MQPDGMCQLLPTVEQWVIFVSEPKSCTFVFSKEECEDNGLHTPKAPILCINNCGFFGSSMTKNFVFYEILKYSSDACSKMLSSTAAGCTCRCFSPRGVTPTSKFVRVLPFPDGDARRHIDLSWFGQEKALRPAVGGEKFVLSCT